MSSTLQWFITPSDDLSHARSNGDVEVQFPGRHVSVNSSLVNSQFVMDQIPAVGCAGQCGIPVYQYTIYRLSYTPKCRIWKRITLHVSWCFMFHRSLDSRIFQTTPFITGVPHLWSHGPPDSGPSCNSAQTMRPDPSDPIRRDGGFPGELSGLGIQKTEYHHGGDKTSLSI